MRCALALRCSHCFSAHALTHPHARARAHTHTHTLTHIHTHTRTHTHTHTHAHNARLPNGWCRYIPEHLDELPNDTELGDLSDNRDTDVIDTWSPVNHDHYVLVREEGRIASVAWLE